VNRADDDLKDAIDRLVAEVCASRRYRDIDANVVRRVGAQELAKRRNLKEAVHATRSKLHQVGGSYQEKAIDYAGWSKQLAALGKPPKIADLKSFCREMMLVHASTRERLGILDVFFQETLGALAPVHSILDIGCGLTPLSLSWMPLATDAVYYGCDIYKDMISFLGAFLDTVGLEGGFTTCDLIASVPSQTVQVALLLKTLPCLEQMDRHCSLRLLEKIQAEYILVS